MAVAVAGIIPVLAALEAEVAVTAVVLMQPRAGLAEVVAAAVAAAESVQWAAMAALEAEEVVLLLGGLPVLAAKVLQ